MPLPDLVVNRSSPVPLYFQVAEQIERAIHDGHLLPGDRIANEVALADQLGLSRPTMRQAIQTLVDKGMLVRKRGVGTQVVHAPIRRSVELTSLYDDLKRSGLRPTHAVLGLDLVHVGRRGTPSSSTCRRHDGLAAAPAAVGPGRAAGAHAQLRPGGGGRPRPGRPSASGPLRALPAQASTSASRTRPSAPVSSTRPRRASSAAARAIRC